jgi:putative transposase
VREELAQLFLTHGCPRYIRSDHGPEFIAKSLRGWLGQLTVSPLCIEPGSPGENGYLESFNGKLRDERLNGEVFYTLLEARVRVEGWRELYNTKRPHSALGSRPPAPEAWLKPVRVSAVANLRSGLTSGSRSHAAGYEAARITMSVLA